MNHPGNMGATLESRPSSRLLVVSSSASARLLYQFEFEDEGYAVSTLENLHGAAVGLSSSVDVILYDPGPKVQECARGLAILREIWQRVPIVLYSTCDVLTIESLPQKPDVYLARSSDLAPLVLKVNQLRTSSGGMGGEPSALQRGGSVGARAGQARAGLVN